MGHQCTKLRCYRIQHEQVIGTNRFTLPVAVCCCLQTYNFCYCELFSLDISIPSFVVIGPGTHNIYKFTLPVHVAVSCYLQYKLVISVMANSYHGTSVASFPGPLSPRTSISCGEGKTIEQKFL